MADKQYPLVGAFVQCDGKGPGHAGQHGFGIALIGPHQRIAITRGHAEVARSPQIDRLVRVSLHELEGERRAWGRILSRLFARAPWRAIAFDVDVHGAICTPGLGDEQVIEGGAPNHFGGKPGRVEPGLESFEWRGACGQRERCD